MGPEEGRRLDLLQRGARLTAAVKELALDHLEGRAVDGFTHVGTGWPEIVAAFGAMEAHTRTSLYSLNPKLLFDPWDPAMELDHRSRERGIEMLTVVSQTNLQLNPLLSSIDPQVHVGDAVFTMLVIDRARVVAPGPLTGDGDLTAWSTTLPHILDPALELWDQVWAESRPVLAPGSPPPFTPRQVQVALLLTRGLKDAAIAREVGVSIRTVVSEVACLAEALGVRSRVETVLALRRGAQRRTTGESLQGP